MKTIAQKTLYKVDQSRGLRRWALTATVETPLTGILTIEYGLVGGAQQVKKEQVRLNSTGRNAEEQALLRFNSRINKQLDKGYKETKEQAILEEKTNASGLILPMKAQVYEPTKHKDISNYAVQYKYNGHRCIIHMTPEGPIAYSRNGKPITSVPHVLKAAENLPIGAYIDGELYIHGMPLTDITSLVRCKQPESAGLKFIAFDYISNDPFIKRFNTLADSKLNWDVLSLAPTIYQWGHAIMSKQHIKSQAIDLGYEGLILRTNTKGYEGGARSSQVLKAKLALDAEFEVVNIVCSVDDWAILTCKVSNGKTFNVSAPGTIEQKKDIYDNWQTYIGKFVTVEFAEWTKYGLPFHPRALHFRNANTE